MKQASKYFILSSRRRAQTILEMFMVVMFATFFMAISFYLFNLYDVSTKQVALTRTQAMIELGNFSDYSGSEHGQDDPGDRQSQVFFILGEDSGGTRVPISAHTSFQEAVQGELSLTGNTPQEGDGRFWANFRFPRSITTVKSRARLPGGGAGDEGSAAFEFTLQQRLAIAHARNIDVYGDSEGDVENGLFSGSVHFFDLQNIASNPLSPGQGLVDNHDFLIFTLRNLAKADPSLANEAQAFEQDLSLVDFIEGSADAVLISLAIQLAAQAAAGAVVPADAASGTLGGIASNLGTASAGLSIAGSAAALAGQGDLARGLGIAGSATGAIGGLAGAFNSFGQFNGDFLNDFGVFNNFVSQVTSTANLGFQLAGKNIEGLQVASQITGALGGFSSGIYKLQNAEKASQAFAGFGGILNAGSSVASLAGEADLARALGIAGAGFGLGAAIANTKENWNASWKEPVIGEDGAFVLNADGSVQMEVVHIDNWQRTSMVGEVFNTAGSFIGQLDPGSEAAMYASLAGGALGTVGMSGTFAKDLKNGEYEGEAFSAISTFGTIVATASGAGIQAAQLSGNQDLAEAFAIGAIAGGAIAITGMVGDLAQDLGEDFKEWQEERAAKKELNKVLQEKVEGLADGQEATASDLRAAVNEAIQSGRLTEETLASLESEDFAAAFERFDTTKDTTTLDQALDDFGKEMSAKLKKAGSEFAKQFKAPEDPGAFATSDERAQYELAMKNHYLKLGHFSNTVARTGFTLMALIGDKQKAAAVALQGSTAEQFQAALAQQSAFTPQQQLQQTSQNYVQVERELRGSLPPREFQRVQPLIQQTQAMLTEMQKPAVEQNANIIQRGMQAQQKLQDEMARLRDVQARDEDRRLTTAERIAAGIEPQETIDRTLRMTLQRYELITRKDFESLAMVNYAEQNIQGKRLIQANYRQRQRMRSVGQQAADFLAQHRQAFYRPETPLYYRSKMAEHAYRNMRFTTPRKVFDQIQDAVKQRERNYQRVLSAMQQPAQSAN